MQRGRGTHGLPGFDAGVGAVRWALYAGLRLGTPVKTAWTIEGRAKAPRSAGSDDEELVQIHACVGVD